MLRRHHKQVRISEKGAWDQKSFELVHVVVQSQCWDPLDRSEEYAQDNMAVDTAWERLLESSLKDEAPAASLRNPVTLGQLLNFSKSLFLLLLDMARS